MIKLKNVSKFYYNKTNISSGFTKLNLELDMGEFVVITGESGSGKSTLLNVISGLDSYEEGEMYINGEETSHYTEVDYENYRRKYIGNIFQHFNLVNSYTVYQNVELVLLLNGYKKKEARKKIIEIIDTVGLRKFANTKASKLSGGQKQRVAIARALAKDTPIIVADEPTGNLDVASAKSIMKLLKEISKDKLVVIVTHNYEQVSEYATRKISMNDGKIIEDKKLQKFDKCKADEVDYHDLTFVNKILLGIRNAFNIKIKFALLFLVYFFLTLLVFSEYSGLQKQDFTDSLGGYNYLFNETSPNRVILNKKDKTPFNKEEIANLGKLDNVKSVVTNDLALDAMGAVVSDDYRIYMPCFVKEEVENMVIDEGRLPMRDDEAVLKVSKTSDLLSFYKDDLSSDKLTLQENMTGEDIDKIKIVGIVYSDDEDYIGTLYLKKNLLDKFIHKINDRYQDIFAMFDKNEREGIRSIKSHPRVKEGEVYIYSGCSYHCKNMDCTNQQIDVKVKNIYYEESLTLRVAETISESNYKSLLGLQNWDDVNGTLFVSEVDYDRLFAKGDYQISIFLEDLKKDAESLEKLEKMGYDHYYIRDNQIQPDAQITGIIKIIRNVVFIGATVALFFICYFIIKIILKSRNIYFSTIRILGATKKIARQLLNIELFVDINVAYFVFLTIVSLTKTGILNWKYIEDLVTYFNFGDYVAIYVVLVFMSLLISNRYAHKLFKNSAMSTYREEV